MTSTKNSMYNVQFAKKLEEAGSIENVEKFIEHLNDNQKEAVLQTEGPLLILAGAGTGKTRTLMTRLAYIIANRKALPYETLTVTFTNKAANEMRERAQQLVEPLTGSEPRWLGTFHALSARMLRQHSKLIGLGPDYSILDSSDQEKLCTEIMEEAGFSKEKLKEKWPPRLLKNKIDRWKNHAILPEQVPVEEQNFADGKVARLYKQYQSRLSRLNSCDFGDLLLHMIEVLRSNKFIQEKYNNQFKYISVDEYQDTNIAQYLWLRLLTNEQSNICCVGDDDQSIYGWRGAEVKNILNFSKQYKNVTIIRLEGNYRSTKHILSTATFVIQGNKNRHEKILYPAGSNADLSDIDRVKVRSVYSGDDEVRLISDDIESWRNKLDRKYQEVAILVRATWQLRIFETYFIEYGIPYRVIGGPRFYERAEIKDAISYLKLINTPDNDLAFERVVNQPRRGIGNSTILKLRGIARDQNTSMFEATQFALNEGVIKGKAGSGLSKFIALIVKWQSQLTENLKISELLKGILDDTKYIDMLKAQEGKSYHSGTQRENINELLSDVEKHSELKSYLERIELNSDRSNENSEDEVQLLTLHAAKGLEFPLVFLPGWEENIFPNARSISESSEAIEEERRLAYVGITRAKDSCRISFAQGRSYFGSWQCQEPSRFLEGLPEDDVEMNYYS